MKKLSPLPIILFSIVALIALILFTYKKTAPVSPSFVTKEEPSSPEVKTIDFPAEIGKDKG